MLDKQDFAYIGTTGRTHGLGGELTARLSVDIAPLMEADEPLFLMLEEDGLLIPFRLESHRTKAGDIDLLKFSQLDTLEQAELWSDHAVWLHHDYIDDDKQAGELSDYIGYQVYQAHTHRHLGIITDVDDSTLNTLLNLQTTGGEELLLPLASELIEQVDLVHRSIYLHIAEGLLNL